MIFEMFLFQIYCFIHFQSNSKLPRTKHIVFLTRFVSGLWQSGAIRKDKVIATAKQQYHQKFQKKLSILFFSSYFQKLHCNNWLLKFSIFQVHCDLHLQHIQRNNWICHHSQYAHSQVWFLQNYITSWFTSGFYIISCFTSRSFPSDQTRV